jgi:hypothetical protein
MGPYLWFVPGLSEKILKQAELFEHTRSLERRGFCGGIHIQFIRDLPFDRPP